MQLEHAPASRLIMQIVDILRDERELPNAPFEFGERIMSGIGPGLSDEPAPPVIPFPHELRIARERLRRGKLFGPILAP